MKKINKLVNENVVSSSVNVSVDTGVNYLIKCKYEINKNVIPSTPINPENVSWFITLENGNIVSFEFVPSGLFENKKPLCCVQLISIETHQEFKGETTHYYSLGFLNELQQNIITECNVNINTSFDMVFGEPLTNF